ncbi:MAG TPA: hypothetical protein VFQ45_00520, partial [Longimicrobium sp.]|nr:hypothetical protein [Longimicrobium sp.]
MIRGGGRFGFRLAAVGALAAAPACVPVVKHGPRVEPGVVWGSVVSLGTDSIFKREIQHGQGNVSPVLPPFAVFVRHGWSPESAGAPFAISAGLSI